MEWHWQVRLSDDGLMLDAVSFGLLSGVSGMMQAIRAVYVAYLDEECGLIRAYPLRLMPGEDMEVAVAADARAQCGCCQVIVGPAAELLYVAVSGRLLDMDVAEAAPRRAAIARAILASNLEAPGFSEAYAAAVGFGDWIEPWYGLVALDQGELLSDLECYRERIDLPLTLGVRDGEMSGVWG